MDKALVHFIQALRHHGVPVSPAESLDALNATALVGLADRQRLKNTLTATLSKSLVHQGVLDRVFDDFFKPPAAHRKHTTPPISQSFNPGANLGTVRSMLGRQLQNNDSASLHQAMVEAGEAAGIRQMQLFLQKHRVAGKILQTLGDRELQHELRELEAQGTHLELVTNLKQRREQLVAKVKDYTEQQFLLFSSHKGQSLSEDILHKVKLTHLDQAQRKQMARLVTRMARKLASLHSRRRKIYKTGVLDLRKTIAANAAYDGHLYRLRWKSTRRERPKVIVICDVSGSVSQIAQFLLLFVYSLQDVLPRVRSFVFSNAMAEVTANLQSHDLDDALTLVLERWAGRSTDYGRALADFSDLALADVDHRTQVIMLGDARNNFGDSRLDIWRAVCNRAQRVLWLNPEDPSQWNSGDSVMREYGVHCSLVEQCSSLRDMERVLGRLLKHSS